MYKSGVKFFVNVFLLFRTCLLDFGGLGVGPNE